LFDAKGKRRVECSERKEEKKILYVALLRKNLQKEREDFSGEGKRKCIRAKKGREKIK